LFKKRKTKKKKEEKSLELFSNSDDVSFNVVMGNAITQMQARSKRPHSKM